MEQRRAARILRADELDRPPGELDRATGGADEPGQLGRPGAHLGEVDSDELGRARYGGPSASARSRCA